MPIQFIGLNSLEKKESDVVRGLAVEYYDRILRDLPQALLVLNTKIYDQEGKKKFSLHARINAPGIVLVTEAADWDLRRTVHKVMKKMERELQHKFKTEGHLPKPK